MFINVAILNNIFYIFYMGIIYKTDSNCDIAMRDRWNFGFVSLNSHMMKLVTLLLLHHLFNFGLKGQSCSVNGH